MLTTFPVASRVAGLRYNHIMNASVCIYCCYNRHGRRGKHDCSTICLGVGIMDIYCVRAFVRACVRVRSCLG